MSKGCLHKCAFCIVPKGVTEVTSDIIDAQVEAFKKVDTKLVYLDDKTFGQAKNHVRLPEIYEKLKTAKPDFQGFIIQTTATQMRKGGMA
jgi:tRNA A37 methylthiotransferase MiaB